MTYDKLQSSLVDAEDGGKGSSAETHATRKSFHQCPGLSLVVKGQPPYNLNDSMIKLKDLLLLNASYIYILETEATRKQKYEMECPTKTKGSKARS